MKKKKKILLTLDWSMFSQLEKYQKENKYLSVQEAIRSLIRKYD